MKNNILIEKITPDKWAELKPFAAKMFYEAFALQNTQENMELYMSTAFSDEKVQAELNNPNSKFYYAKIQDLPVGYMKLNFEDAQSEIQGSESFEIERIYIDKSYQNHGIGAFLLDFALGKGKAQNKKYAWLAVWEHNLKAIEFYQRNGFNIFDKHSFVLGTDIQTDIMMKRAL